MWQTPDGIRKLQGAEARLVRAAAALLYDELKNRGEPDQFGARAFDRLSLDHQMFSVLAVAQRLTDDLQPLPLDAWAEATVWALFEFVHYEIAYEIEVSQTPGEKPWLMLRRLVRDALVEKWETTESASIPAPESTDLRDWDFAVLYLSDCILWDRDFLDEDIYDGTGHPPDYFTAQPPEWTPSQKRDLLDFYKQSVDEANRLVA